MPTPPTPEKIRQQQEEKRRAQYGQGSADGPAVATPSLGFIVGTTPVGILVRVDIAQVVGVWQGGIRSAVIAKTVVAKTVIAKTCIKATRIGYAGVGSTGIGYTRIG